MVEGRPRDTEGRSNDLRTWFQGARHMPTARPGKTVFLHIGMPKTGTTTIQHFLAENMEALRRNGCLYPGTGLQHQAHHPIGALLLDRRLGWVDSLVPNPDPSLLGRLEREIEKRDCSTIVISTELLAFIRDTRKAIDYFSQYDVRLLFFIRRQDHWMESLCRQEMKTGTYTDTDPRQFIDTRIWEADYLEYLERWGKHFDRTRMTVVLLDRGLDPAPIQRRFLSACNVAWSDDYSINRNENTKLTQECLHFLINSPVQDRIDAFHARVNAAIGEYSQTHPEPAEYRWLLSPEQRREILERMHDRNVMLAREYLSEAEAKVFLDMSVDTKVPWQKYPGLSARKAVEIAYFLLAKVKF